MGRLTLGDTHPPLRLGAALEVCWIERRAPSMFTTTCLTPAQSSCKCNEVALEERLGLDTACIALNNADHAEYEALSSLCIRFRGDGTRSACLGPCSLESMKIGFVCRCAGRGNVHCVGGKLQFDIDICHCALLTPCQACQG